VKLPTPKGGASREGISFYIVPLYPALKGEVKGNLPVPCCRNEKIIRKILKIEKPELLAGLSVIANLTASTRR
jgi:hypothetical protein